METPMFLFPMLGMLPKKQLVSPGGFNKHVRNTMWNFQIFKVFGKSKSISKCYRIKNILESISTIPPYRRTFQDPRGFFVFGKIDCLICAFLVCSKKYFFESLVYYSQEATTK